MLPSPIKRKKKKERQTKRFVSKNSTSHVIAMQADSFAEQYIRGSQKQRHRAVFLYIVLSLFFLLAEKKKNKLRNT